MSDTPRLTPQTVAVIRALLQTPATPRWGRDIARETGLKSGSLHPILARLEQAGWVESHWEEPDVVEQGRPRRRYYRFAPDGAQTAQLAIAQADYAARTSAPRTSAPRTSAPRTSTASRLYPQAGY